MRKHFRLLSILLVLCLFVLCACNKDNKKDENKITVTKSLANMPVLVGDIAVSFPLVDTDTSFNVLISQNEEIDPKTVYVWKTYETMTGITVNWTTTTSSDRKEDVDDILTNKKDCDLLFKCKISSEKLTQYGESGLILDLTDNNLLKDNAPNCWKYLLSHPDALASIMDADGSIYSLPQVNSGAELRVSRKLFINKTWLSNVNMEVPTTTEELYSVLKAFKEQDANNNGDKNDEIPLSSHDWVSIQDALFGAFGLANRGVHNTEVDIDEETGKVRFIASCDGYKDYLTYLNRLYTEGLLDNSIFTSSSETFYNNADNDLVGSFAHTNLAGLPADKTNNWVAVNEALEGPNGDKLWSAIRANFHSVGAAVIPSTCDNPALVLQWLDYFWTDEGTLFYHMGIEGKTFKVNEDKKTFAYLPTVLNQIEELNSSFDKVISKYSPYPGGNNPTVEIAPYFNGGETAEVPAAAARSLFEYGPKEYWPDFTFTVEENDVLETLNSDIEKYVEQMRIEFITGKTPLSKWDEYKAQLEKMNVSKVLSIYQNAVDRYNGFLEE